MLFTEGCCSEGACCSDGAPAAKRHKATQQAAPQFVVLDIEGTVAPVYFVYEVMFPYVTRHLQEYLDRTWDTAQTQAEIKELLAEVCSSHCCMFVACRICTAHREPICLCYDFSVAEDLCRVGQMWFARGDNVMRECEEGRGVLGRLSGLR